MKLVPLIFTCAASFAAGFLFTPGPTTARVQDPTAKPDTIRGGGNDLATAFAAPSDANTRIVRMYSALHEQRAMKRRHDLAEALDDLTADDLPGLVTHAEDLPYLDRQKLLPVLLDRWFEVDFDGAKQWMLGHPRQFESTKAWSRANPEAALQDALAMPDDRRASTLLGEAIKQLAGDNPAAQLARLKTLPSGKQRDDVFIGILANWAKTDPAAAYTALGEFAPGRTFDSARDAVLREWAGSDPAGCLAQMDAVVPTLKADVLGNDLIKELTARIGRKDPHLVLDWLGTLPVEFRSTAAIFAAGAWAAKEPLAALDWCLANGVDVARGRRNDFFSWQSGVLGEALGAKPGETVAWLEALPAGSNRDRLMERGFADSLWRAPKDRLFGPEDGIAFRLFNELPEEAQMRNATELGRARMERGDLTDLNDWAENFAPGAVRANAIAGAIGAAYERDASQVEALLAGTRSARDRDAALRGLAETMRFTAPAGAAGRAVEIGDAALRRETLEPIVTFWIKRDPDAAHAWLQDADNIPADWKRAWMQPE